MHYATKIVKVESKKISLLNFFFAETHPVLFKDSER